MFVVNPDTLSRNLVDIMRAMGGVIGYDENRCKILLEIEINSSNLPCSFSSRGNSGFSISENTFFWGLQWIGSFGWIKYNEKDTYFLTFASAGAGIECLNEHYKTLPNIASANVLSDNFVVSAMAGTTKLSDKTLTDTPIVKKSPNSIDQRISSEVKCPSDKVRFFSPIKHEDQTNINTINVATAIFTHVP